MKTIALFIILVAATSLVNAMKPAELPLISSLQAEITVENEQVAVNTSSIRERNISRINLLRSIFNKTNLNSELPENAPIPPVNLNDSIALVALYRATNGPDWTINDNWLTGRVGTWHGITVAAGRVSIIDLENNNLQGTIHDSIGYLTNLSTLNLSNNLLTDTVPEEIENIPYLTELYLSSNELNGNLFDLLINQIYLMKIDIAYNQFSGMIPDDIGSFEYLDELRINDNKFIFKNIEPIFEWGNYGNFSSAFTYSPQAEVGAEDTIEMIVGDPLRISMSGYEPGNYDVYQWYKDYEILDGQTDSIIEILSATTEDAGDYYCIITNTTAEDLTLTSKYIQVNFTNHPPVADAGPDQLDVDEGYVDVTLDGSASYDADFDELIYNWRAPEEIFLEDSTVTYPIFTAPEVSDTTTFTITLVVFDGTDYSARDTVLIRVNQVNKPPLAVAGDDQHVNEGVEVVLDGSASWDPEEDPIITYTWSSPAGIVLDDNYISNPTFTAPDVTADTILTFSLVVNDGLLDSDPDEVLVYVDVPNQMPVADAGDDQDVNEGIKVTLDGTGSYDPDADSLYFSWSHPDIITLSDSTAIEPTFYAPEVDKDTTFVFYLTVNDGSDDSEPDTIKVDVRHVNKLPVAEAGYEQEAYEGWGIILDGSGSYDPDEDSLSYSWSHPAIITLSDSTAIEPTFTVPEIDKDTTFIFVLIVNDGFVDSEPDTVKVTVWYENTPPVAVAGDDQEVAEGVVVNLDGSGSNDPDEDSLYYSWSHPDIITLSDSTAIEPTFTAPEVDKDTTFVFVLVVNDDTDDSEPDTILVTVWHINKPPVAYAGDDQEHTEGDEITLIGSGSSDPDKDSLYFSWSHSVEITLDSMAIDPTFIAPEVDKDTTYVFVLLVNDGTVDSEPDTILVTILNVVAVPETLSVIDTTVRTSLSACFDALQTITVASVDHPVVFESGSTVDLIAGLRINLMPGFHASSGSNTHAYISTQFCPPLGSIVMNSGDGTKSKEYIPYALTEENSLKEKMVKVYPNPNDGRFTIELSNFDAPVQLTIFNTQGIVLLNKTSTMGENPLLDISYLNRGLYFIKVKSDNFMQTKKIIIK